MDHDSGSGLEELYACYTKHNVEFAKEYCDNSFLKPYPYFEPEKLDQCYGTKGVPKGIDFCYSTYYTFSDPNPESFDEQDIPRV